MNITCNYYYYSYLNKNVLKKTDNAIAFNKNLNKIQMSQILYEDDNLIMLMVIKGA